MNKLTESITFEITDIDWAFADMVLKKYALKDAWLREFLAQMMAKTRQGHVCQEISEDQLSCLPECLVAKDGPANRLLKYHGSMLYFHRYWHLETRLISPLLKRIQSDKKPQPTAIIEGLNQRQSEALSKAVAHSLFILSGGPGTGKTYTIARIVEQFAGQSIALTAPTGKAIAKLKSSIVNPGIFFGTLHALLGIKQPQDIIEKRQELPYDVVIVDECSMIDIGMWGALLEACLDKTKLILVGDANQLPPVEGGNVFEQLVFYFKECKSSQLVELTECMRTDRLELKQMANHILNGKVESLVLIDIPVVDELLAHLRPLYRDKFPDDISNEKIVAESKKFQMLSALRKGPHGCDALNQAIYHRITDNLKQGNRVAVPIIVTRNAFDLGLSNGDTGIWIHGDDKDTVIIGEKVLPRAMVPGFDLAYVLSVHKSQGSEYDHVYLLLPPGSEYFGRKVLYTAVTRARSKLTIAGCYDTVKLCAENVTARLSGLKDRLTCKK